MTPRRVLPAGFLAICILSTLVVISGAANGEEPANRGVGRAEVGPLGVSRLPPETYGTASQTVMVMGSYMFEADAPATTIQPGIGIERYITSGGGCCAVAHPVLPSGALVEKIELRACDTSDTAWVTAGVYTCETPGQGCSLGGVGAMVQTGGGFPDMPGCGNFASTLNIPIQVDNQNPLSVVVSTGPTTATTFSAVKLYYRLQVSPAPGVATFSDVPTSYWAFQWIEALKASGITVGCTPSTYCPEDPVTRAQMAVFLAKALGLHWQN